MASQRKFEHVSIPRAGFKPGDKLVQTRHASTPFSLTKGRVQGGPFSTVEDEKLQQGSESDLE